MTSARPIVTQDQADRLATKLQAFYDGLPENDKWLMTLILTQAARASAPSEPESRLGGHLVLVTLDHVPWVDPDLGTTGGQLVIPVHPLVDRPETR